MRQLVLIKLKIEEWKDERNITFSEWYTNHDVYNEDKPHDQQCSWQEYRDVVFDRLKPPLQQSFPPGVPAKMKRIKVHRWNEMKAQRNAYQIHKQAYQKTFKGSFKKV